MYHNVTSYGWRIGNKTSRRFSLWSTISLLLISLLGCQQNVVTGAIRVTIAVDGQQVVRQTEAETVRQLLDEAEIVLQPLDKVKPDLYTSLEPGLIIVVTRIREEVISEQEILPFDQQTVTNEALAPGETRLAQLGVEGVLEISWRVVYENGQEVSRTEIERMVLTPPVSEVLVVGPQGELPLAPIDGTMAYLSVGNGWVVRGSNRNRRPVTSDGNLDGHVFDLSPDGTRLLYTIAVSDAIETPLNELWQVDTTIIGEEPEYLELNGILHAHWSPVISETRIAYSTAERTPSAPGWRANNDLWLFDPTTTSAPVQLLPPNQKGLYAWWGTSLSWSPNGQKLAYARPDEIGIISLTDTLSVTITPLYNFTPLDTFSEWVWTPHLSWSPDSQFVASTVHGPPLNNEPAAESQQFDLWLFHIDSRLAVKLKSQVGMWSNPVWGRRGIAFGEAVKPMESVNSRYRVHAIDRDGSNQRQIFPVSSEPGLIAPTLAWSPDGTALAYVYNGNVYQRNLTGGSAKQITQDSQVRILRWVLGLPPTSLITVTTPFTLNEIEPSSILTK